MKKKRNLLSLYEEWMKITEEGYPALFDEYRYGKVGLCSAVENSRIENSYMLSEELAEVMQPTDEDRKNYEVYNNAWWGSGTHEPLKGEFNENRQNLLLLFAAYNNQL